jgi:hypothetical protein
LARRFPGFSARVRGWGVDSTLGRIGRISVCREGMYLKDLKFIFGGKGLLKIFYVLGRVSLS